MSPPKPLLPSLLLALLLPLSSPDTQAQPPNILFIVADDLSAAALGCYGNTVCQTPHIDRLAAEGVRFEGAYCQYPVCGASRASFMSGLYPETTGFLANNLAIGSYRALNPGLADHPSIGGFLRRNGYVSARVSKIFHMGVPGGIEAGDPGGDDPDSWDRAYNIWGPETGSIGRFENLSPALPHWGSAFVRVIVPNDRASTQTDEMATSQAVAILENRAGHRNETNFLKPGQSLFLAVGMVRPHVPLVAPERHFAAYPAERMNLPEVPAGSLDDVPAPNRSQANATRYRMTPRQQSEALAAYYACVSYLDEQVGRLLDALDRTGLAGNTVVVLTSDHGWLLGEHDSWQKMNLFEPTCRVPLIIRAPGFEDSAGRTSHALVELVDLYPTFADLAGLDDKAPDNLQGHSLTPLLEDPESDDWPREAAYTVMGGARAVHGSIRTGRFRYSRYAGGAEELYDHRSDPDEHVNQARNPEYEAALGEMRQLWDRTAERARNPSNTPPRSGSSSIDD